MKRPLCLICLVFVLTLYCYMECIGEPSYPLEGYDGCYMELTGQIYQKEFKQDQLILYLKHVTFCDEKKSQMKQQNINNIVCYCRENVSAAFEPDLGMYVQVEGQIRKFSVATNPGEFDFRKYYHMLNIDVSMENTVIKKHSLSGLKRLEWLYDLKRDLCAVYDKRFTPKEAAILKTMVFGERHVLDAESKELYQKAGIAHILAISGLHIAMLGGILFQLLKKLRVPIAINAFICIVLMLQYGEMTGMSSSAYRAIIMFSAKLLAICIRRSYDMLTAMMIASMTILLENPMYIYHSGFRLSFGAIIGLGLFTPVFCSERAFTQKKKKWESIKQMLQGSIAVSAVHFPLLALQYASYPLFSNLINLLIIPLLSILFGAGISVLILDTLFPMLTGIPVFVIHVILLLYEDVAKVTIDCFAGIWITGCPNLFQLILYVLILCWLLYAYKNMSLLFRYLYLFAGILILTVNIRIGEQITILDVGQGDGICIETEKGHCYLIDGGSTSKKKVGTYQLIPFLKYEGIDQIEAVFLTHLDDDHTAGIKELMERQKREGIRIKNIILAQAVVKDEAYEEIVTLGNTYGVKIRSMHAEEEITDGNVKIKCLFPYVDYQTEDRNAASLVLEVSCGKFKGLFTGDVSEEGEAFVTKVLHNENAQCYQLFKATHHGSKYSNTEQLLKQIKPELTVISCGKDNRYGHPHEETIERFLQVGTKILRTDQSGAITIRIVGKHWCEKEFVRYFTK